MKKILVINDCKFESIVMKDCLSDIGYSVKIASEYDAIIETRKFQPDILIANLIMKNTTGDKLISKIKSENSQIICLLSSCDPIKLEDFIENKVDEVINTPVNKDRLSETLDKVTKDCDNIKIRKNSVDTIIKRLVNKSNRKQEDVSLDKKSSLSVSRFLFCPFCGQRFDEISQGFSFCPYCGKTLQTSK